MEVPTRNRFQKYSQTHTAFFSFYLLIFTLYQHRRTRPVFTAVRHQHQTLSNLWFRQVINRPSHRNPLPSWICLEYKNHRFPNKRLLARTAFFPAFAINSAKVSVWWEESKYLDETSNTAFNLLSIAWPYTPPDQQTWFSTSTLKFFSWHLQIRSQ